MSKLRDRSHRHDVFHRKAKAEGFVARAVYKLEETLVRGPSRPLFVEPSSPNSPLRAFLARELQLATL